MKQQAKMETAVQERARWRRVVVCGCAGSDKKDVV